MIKITIFITLLMTSAVTFNIPASDNVQVANVDKDSHFRLIKPAISPNVTEKDEYYEVQGRNGTRNCVVDRP